MSDDPRFTGYWAAIRADLNKQTVDAVIRLADNEQAELVARLRGATDDELARRLEWATGRNGNTLLDQIRGEGLDLMAVRPEDPS